MWKLATSESDFKIGFKKNLRERYPGSVIWTNSDKFRSGLPDFSVSFDGHFYAVEAKFIKDTPKMKDSQCLKHCVSKSQSEFLLNIRASKNSSGILIGMPDVCVLMKEIKENYTLSELLDSNCGYIMNRGKGLWHVDLFLETMRRFSGG